MLHDLDQFSKNYYSVFATGGTETSKIYQASGFGFGPGVTEVTPIPALKFVDLPFAKVSFIPREYSADNYHHTYMKFSNRRVFRGAAADMVKTPEEHFIDFVDKVQRLDQSRVVVQGTNANSGYYYINTLKRVSYNRFLKGEPFKYGGRYWGGGRTLLFTADTKYYENYKAHYLFAFKNEYIEELKTALISGAPMKNYWFVLYVDRESVPELLTKKGAFTAPFYRDFISPYEEKGISIVEGPIDLEAMSTALVAGESSSSVEVLFDQGAGDREAEELRGRQLLFEAVQGFREFRTKVGDRYINNGSIHIVEDYVNARAFGRLVTICKQYIDEEYYADIELTFHYRVLNIGQSQVKELYDAVSKSWQEAYFNVDEVPHVAFHFLASHDINTHSVNMEGVDIQEELQSMSVFTPAGITVDVLGDFWLRDTDYSLRETTFQEIKVNGDSVYAMSGIQYRLDDNSLFTDVSGNLMPIKGNNPQLQGFTGTLDEIQSLPYSFEGVVFNTYHRRLWYKKNGVLFELIHGGFHFNIKSVFEETQWFYASELSKTKFEVFITYGRIGGDDIHTGVLEIGLKPARDLWGITTYVKPLLMLQQEAYVES